MSGIRRAQLIAPFGVGAIVAMRQGRTVVVAGLDHWFSEHALPDDRVAIDEFLVDEPRLSRHLGVKQLRLPPDFRRSMPFAAAAPNTSMSVPALRFPRWHVCKICRRLSRFSAEGVGRLTCPVDGCRGRQIQVRFVAMCPAGHLDDFPWREWAHSTSAPPCQKPMRLEVRGSASLDALWIVCDCDKKRSLAGITVFDRDKGTSILTDDLSNNDSYRCHGRRPWVNDFSGTECGEYLIGTLMNATNVYFADVRSSIFLPAEATSAVAQRVLELIESSPIIEDDIALMRQMSSDVAQIASMLRKRHQQNLAGFPEAEIARALDAMASPEAHGVTDALEDDRNELKRAEYPVLQQNSTREDLRIRAVALDEFGSLGPEPFANFFGKVQLVDKLRETRAFTGFTRITSPSAPNRTSSSARPPYPMLWKVPPALPDAWLPAYVVHGEGIFIEFSEERLCEWEDRRARSARSRLQALGAQWSRFNPTSIATAPVSARFVMMHTFSHLVINRLVFESGYSTAAVRERIYSAEGPKPMSAVLLYTASGDSEGTMGGLVALGEPGRIEGILVRALETASWCSADPVCIEAGTRGGQGPDSCNLAACHSCALLPETSCEALNRFLDRGLVIGTPDEPDLGFFGTVLR